MSTRKPDCNRCGGSGRVEDPAHYEEYIVWGTPCPTIPCPQCKGFGLEDPFDDDGWDDDR